MTASAKRQFLTSWAAACAQGVIHDDPTVEGPDLRDAIVQSDPISCPLPAEAGGDDTISTVFYAREACTVTAVWIVPNATLGATGGVNYRTFELRVCDGAGAVAAAVATYDTQATGFTAATNRSFTLTGSGVALAAGESLRLYSTATAGGAAMVDGYAVGGTVEVE